MARTKKDSVAAKKQPGRVKKAGRVKTSAAKKASGIKGTVVAVPAPPSELVVITGLSGAGKASAMKAFEDLGFYAVDNLPLELIPQFAQLVRGSSEIRRAAIVVDVREGLIDRFPDILTQVRATLPTTVLFLGSVRRGAGAALQRDAAATSAGPGRDDRHADCAGAQAHGPDTKCVGCVAGYVAV